MLKINQVVIGNLSYAKITKSNNFNKDAWNNIKISFRRKQEHDFLREEKNSFVCEWYGLLSAIEELKQIHSAYDFSIDYDNESKNKIKQNIKNRNSVKNNFSRIKISKKDILNLKKLGFDKLNLNKLQIRDLQTLLSLPNAANFSVQGSGKTAVLIAAHLMFRADKNVKANSLFVVSPKNVFLAWEDEFNACLNKKSKLYKEGLTELSGSKKELKKKLFSGKRNFIINYEKLVTSLDLISQFLLDDKNKVHIVLDESHKVKSETAQRSQATLQLSTLPAVRKDILTGTPCPNSIQDINTQFQFLYPGLSYQENRFRFFVRTTKRDLLSSGLKITKSKDIKRTFVHVPMSEPQISLYKLVRGDLISLINKKKKISFSKYRDIRRSFMRLLIIASNPLILTKKQFENGEFYYGDRLQMNLHKALIKEAQEGGSPKIQYACEMARKFASEGQKTIIWSYFKNTIESLGKYYLKDLNAEYIHGGVEIGSEDEFDTRKYKIKKFKDPDSDCKVLIANYASCAEGISLHHVCHNAIYIDRSFQADQYLQSEDRIIRLGNDNQKNIFILQSKMPSDLQNIDVAIKNALERKVAVMSDFLNDPDLSQLAIDESRGELPIDNDVSQEQIDSMIEYFMNENVR